MARSFRQIFLNWIPCEQKIRLREKLLDGKFRLYSCFSDIGRWLNVTFGKKSFRGSCQKCLYAYRETSWKKQFFENFYIRNLFQNLSKKHLAGWSICPYVSSQTLNSDRKLYSLGKIKLFLSFSHNMWNCSANSNENGRVVKLAFTLSSETFWGQSSLNEKFFRFPPSLDFEPKSLRRVVTSASQASQGTIWRRTDFWNDLHFFQIGWMTSGRVQNCNLCVQKNVISDIILNTQSFVFILGLWAKFLW